MKKNWWYLVDNKIIFFWKVKYEHVVNVVKCNMLVITQSTCLNCKRRIYFCWETLQVLLSDSTTSFPVAFSIINSWINLGQEFNPRNQLEEFWYGKISMALLSMQHGL
jgi:hypothetical protein